MTEMSRERREYLARATEYGFCTSILQDEQGVIAIDDDDLRALLSDSAWRERIERQVRELADLLAGPAEYYRGQVAAVLRAIVDTGRGEGDEG